MYVLTLFYHKGTHIPLNVVA